MSTNISETAMYVDTMVYSRDLVTRVDISETMVHGSDTAVKSAAVETTGVEPAMPSASVPSASACEGKIRLAEDSRTQQRSCNADDGPHLPRSGFAIL